VREDNFDSTPLCVLCEKSLRPLRLMDLDFFKGSLRTGQSERKQAYVIDKSYLK